MIAIPQHEGDELLRVEGLRTAFETDAGEVLAVDGVDFVVRKGETLGMVGESGCGKSVTSLSIMRLVEKPGKIIDGTITFGGSDLMRKSPAEMRRIRGNDISMIFQEPMTSLNPVHTVGDQIAEALVLHRGRSRREALLEAVEMLKLVGIPSPEIRVHEYPHQLSGGMRQRVMIAMALSCNPSLLIADEPTTALDVTIQAQILELMRRLKDETGSSVMIITHDLGVIAEMADNVVVLYAGKVVEYTSVGELFSSPRHPYTMALLESIPRITDDRNRRLFPINGSIPNPANLPGGCAFHPRCRFATDLCRTETPPLFDTGDGHQARCWMHDAERGVEIRSLVESSRAAGPQEAQPRVVRGAIAKPGVDGSGDHASTPILDVRNLKKYFPIRGGVFRQTIGHVRAVDDVSFEVYPGETFGLVGESGCGKTTTGRLAIRLLDPTSGSIHFDGRDLAGAPQKTLRRMRREMQIIFQDPFASLNPRMTIGDALAEAYKIHRVDDGAPHRDRVADLLRQVGMEPDHMRRYPHQFSGGQRQRIGIARSIALSPRLIVCDEPVSALDVSIQAQIINLLEGLQESYGLSYLFIAHDLSVVKHISDRVAVMYLGRIVELARTEQLFSNPGHPYTEALLAAAPIPDVVERPDRIILSGDVPSPSDPPAGCRFHTRCPFAMDICKRVEPQLADPGNGTLVACHLRNDPAQPRLTEHAHGTLA